MHCLINKYNSLVMKLLNNHVTNSFLARCSTPSNTCSIKQKLENKIRIIKMKQVMRLKTRHPNLLCRKLYFINIRWYISWQNLYHKMTVWWDIRWNKIMMLAYEHLYKLLSNLISCKLLKAQVFLFTENMNSDISRLFFFQRNIYFQQINSIISTKLVLNINSDLG